MHHLSNIFRGEGSGSGCIERVDETSWYAMARASAVRSRSLSRMYMCVDVSTWHGMS